MRILIIIAINILALSVFGQINNTHQNIRVGFYNLENYFDYSPDKLKNDTQFTPYGDYHWNHKKYDQKTKNIYKVIQNMKCRNCIILLGVCEIENEKVIKHLLYSTPLNKSKLNYVHYESNDSRGIDVALIYSNEFQPIKTSSFELFDNGVKIETRNILYVKGIVELDTFHVFINHWTSRYRGVLESEYLRMEFSNLLKSKVDSLINVNKNASIIIMGDFNDEPHDISLQNLMKVNALFNMSNNFNSSFVKGSVKYREDWYIFDQIIVSESLYLNLNGWEVTSRMSIFDPIWILEDDMKYLGKKPFRTNIGYKYNAGYSDHLPVYIDIINTK
ncbi:MAG: hypothetical protein C0598_09855 [Marinilabiliales bacterium]|nr:MAG: hypothetical protein C0598_09855 [Marinilabiliales bacterium]